MSDFLTDLIARQDKPAGAVRPRLPSMFENGAAAEPAAKPAALLAELTVEQEAPPPAAATPPAPLSQAPRREPQAPQIAETAPAFAPAHAAQERPQPLPPLERSVEREAPAVAPRRGAKTEAPAAEAPERFEETAIQPVVERRVTRLSPIVEESEIVEAPRAAPARRAMETFAPQPSTPPAASVRPLPQPPGPDPIAPVASPFVMPPPQTRQQTREARREPREQPHQARAEPSIQITIGRLEIRASEEREAPRARNKDAPSPVMTLDAYLKSRTKR
jgi:hypothetical protein